MSCEISVSELGLDEFNTFRKDTPVLTSRKQLGGGILVPVHRDIHFFMTDSSVTNAEHIFVSIKLPDVNLIVGAAYVPPNSF